MKKAIMFFRISICCFLLNSLQVALVPFVNYGLSPEQNVVSFVISGCLWGFTILGFVCLHLVRHYCRLAQRNVARGKRRRYKMRPGIFNVLTSVEARVFDILTLLFLVVLIIASIFCSEQKFVVSVSAALFVFAFQMHCILNGKTYIDLKNIKSEEIKR